MGLCPHGINLKNKRCDVCEEVAHAEGQASTKRRVVVPDDDTPPTPPPSKFDRLKERVRIDKDALDEEAMRQPQRFAEVAEQSAYATSRRDMTKDALKTVEAELELAERERADAKGEKVTEAIIKARVQTHHQRQDAYREYLQASLDSDKWEGLKETFKDRSFMLRELGSLYTTGYYTSSAVKGTANAVGDKEYETNRARLREGRRNRDV